MQTLRTLAAETVVLAATADAKLADTLAALANLTAKRREFDRYISKMLVLSPEYAAPFMPYSSSFGGDSAMQAVGASLNAGATVPSLEADFRRRFGDLLDAS